MRAFGSFRYQGVRLPDHSLFDKTTAVENNNLSIQDLDEPSSTGRAKRSEHRSPIDKLKTDYGPPQVSR